MAEGTMLCGRRQMSTAVEKCPLSAISPRTELGFRAVVLA